MTKSTICLRVSDRAACTNFYYEPQIGSRLSLKDHRRESHATHLPFGKMTAIAPTLCLLVGPLADGYKRARYPEDGLAEFRSRRLSHSDLKKLSSFAEGGSCEED